MVLADSNVWLALALSKHAFHLVTHAWFDRQKAPASVLFCRSTQQSFLRLLTTRAVLALYDTPPLSNQSAWGVYESLQADQRISWTAEPRGLETLWKKLTSGSRPSPKLWMDAYLAAFALTGEYQLVTTDKAFKQFRGLDLLVLSKD
jgi:toxin-antitoxin system PIN domain toxin